jgi:hypothetical protein
MCSKIDVMERECKKLEFGVHLNRPLACLSGQTADWGGAEKKKMERGQELQCLWVPRDKGSYFLFLHCGSFCLDHF